MENHEQHHLLSLRLDVPSFTPFETPLEIVMHKKRAGTPFLVALGPDCFSSV